MDVAYILSPARSGSTFLDFLLAGHPQIVGIGEVHQVLREYCRVCGPDNPAHTGDCSCGAEPEACSFWGPLVAELPGLSIRAGFERVLEQCARIYPDKTLIDSSKSGRFLADYYLAQTKSGRAARVRVKVLYLVRDFRGWVVSIW